MGGEASIPVVSLPRSRIAIITGGNAGVGYETGKAIRRMDAEFQAEKAKGTQNIINDDHLDVEFMQLDLGSLESVKEFTDTFIASGRKLHILICNAGIYMPHEVTTVDNLDMTYQVNYLSQFLMVAKFIPVMKKSGSDCRIVLVSSEAHRKAKFSHELASGKQMSEYDGFQCFANTKLFQLMQMYSIDRVLTRSSVEICCVHPGRVKTAHKGAATAIYAAVTPDLQAVSRAYYKESRRAAKWPSNKARDKELQEFLLKSTVDVLKDYLDQDIVNELENS
ncbi:hypothetical protein KUTeg_007475 [Tegillarca granosa]|uniref:Uncharacterized protein n=1 Tax=Tegillarca granosa TaxID=220873 RepID=A0ABQ9FGE1_TEGGR|nr:hypothetical protein KUTeg_007475 [Tegillarca granosa]